MKLHKLLPYLPMGPISVTHCYMSESQLAGTEEQDRQVVEASRGRKLEWREEERNGVRFQTAELPGNDAYKRLSTIYDIYDFDLLGRQIGRLKIYSPVRSIACSLAGLPPDALRKMRAL